LVLVEDQLLRDLTEDLPNIHSMITSQLGADGKLRFNNDLPLILQEVSDYHVFDRPSPKVENRALTWRELATFSEGAAENSPQFMDAIYNHLASSITKAYTAHCNERVSFLGAHDTC
jgi:hypothetical protein